MKKLLILLMLLAGCGGPPPSRGIVKDHSIHYTHGNIYVYYQDGTRETVPEERSHYTLLIRHAGTSAWIEVNEKIWKNLKDGDYYIALGEKSEEE